MSDCFHCPSTSHASSYLIAQNNSAHPMAIRLMGQTDEQHHALPSLRASKHSTRPHSSPSQLPPPFAFSAKPYAVSPRFAMSAATSDESTPRRPHGRTRFPTSRLPHIQTPRAVGERCHQSSRAMSHTSTTTALKPITRLDAHISLSCSHIVPSTMAAYPLSPTRTTCLNRDNRPLTSLTPTTIHFATTINAVAELHRAELHFKCIALQLRKRCRRHSSMPT